MLHVAATALLRLGIGFTLIGLLIARAWGWSEYAAPELYLIHWQQVGPRGQWLIIDAHANTSQPLTWKGAPILALDCSPDGRTLAVLSSKGRLQVITSAGVTYDRSVDAPYDALTVGNDASVVLVEPTTGAIRIDADGITLVANQPDPNLRYHLALGADGWQLWNTDINMVQLATPGGELVRSVFPVSAGRWLAAERFISFGTFSEDLNQFLFDASGQELVILHQAPGVFAPDGLMRAVALRDDQRGNYRTYIGGAFGDAGMRPIPRGPGASDWPVCFVTFRPGILLSPDS